MSEQGKGKLRPTGPRARRLLSYIGVLARGWAAYVSFVAPQKVAYVGFMAAKPVPGKGCMVLKHFRVLKEVHVGSISEDGGR